MKLGILCTMMKRFGIKGFYNSQEIGLGRALSEMGHTVIIYKGVKDKKQVETVRINDRLTVRYMWMPYFVAHGWMPTGRIDKDLDGLFVFSDQQIFLPHVEAFCRKNGIVFVPYVGTTYSLYVHTLRGWIMDTVFAHTTLRIYKRRPILAKTEAAKKELTDLGVDPSLISIAPVGLDVGVLKHDFQSYDRAELKTELGFAADDVILCTVARLEDDKRPLDLLKLFRNVQDRKQFRLLIVGKGQLRQQMDEKIREYGIGDKVKILDRVPYADMWKIYTAADYFLNLSKVEIFGMAIMEAVYYHTSVAAIRAVGPSLTLKGMRGHCLCDTDADIEHWITGPYPSEEELTESAGKVVEDFSWKPCARAFIREIEKQHR